MVNVTPIALSVLALISTIVTIFVIPVLKQKLSAEQREELVKWVDIGVNAAEQLCRSGVIEKDERKKYVQDFLESKGFTINTDEVENAIESAVRQLPSLIVKD